MATVNNYFREMSYLFYIAQDSSERKRIRRSVENLKIKLEEYFEDEIDDVRVFGSFERDTILPRYYDDNSDVDLLVVFNEENDYRPETYRNQLQRFAEVNYPRSVITKSHPSVIVDLEHIKFDLVPARISWDEYEIPEDQQNWQATNPDDVRESLLDANKRYNQIVKPIIRLMKRWNAVSSYPYDSYLLELKIAEMNFKQDNYETGFFYAVERLASWRETNFQERKYNSLLSHVEWIKEYLERDDREKAVMWVDKLFGLG